MKKELKEVKIEIYQEKMNHKQQKRTSDEAS